MKRSILFSAAVLTLAAAALLSACQSPNGAETIETSSIESITTTIDSRIDYQSAIESMGNGFVEKGALDGILLNGGTAAGSLESRITETYELAKFESSLGFVNNGIFWQSLRRQSRFTRSTKGFQSRI